MRCTRGEIMETRLKADERSAFWLWMCMKYASTVPCQQMSITDSLAFLFLSTVALLFLIHFVYNFHFFNFFLFILIIKKKKKYSVVEFKGLKYCGSSLTSVRFNNHQKFVQLSLQKDKNILIYLIRLKNLILCK